jgi:hypothetical protein
MIEVVALPGAQEGQGEALAGERQGELGAAARQGAIEGRAGAAASVEGFEAEEAVLPA